MRVYSLEWANDQHRTGKCGFRLVFNPVAVRFRYRHHECTRKAGHKGLHFCPCGVDYDELGVLFMHGAPVRTSDGVDLRQTVMPGIDHGA